MPHLHLPIDHTDADLVLAANLAEIVGSEDLYVAWSHETGAGAFPRSRPCSRGARAGRLLRRDGRRLRRGLARAARQVVEPRRR